MMWFYKLTRRLLTYSVLYGAANIMLGVGVLCCVVGGFVFNVIPLVTWAGMVLFFGGLCVLGYSGRYLPQEEREKNGNK
jgi:hypothetical protein